MLYIPKEAPRPGATLEEALFVATFVKVMTRGDEETRRVSEKELGQPEVAILESSMSKLALVRSERGAFAMFGGTSNIADWHALSNGTPVDRPYGRIHGAVLGEFAPFAEAFATLSAEAGVELVIGGHGLGGALASIAVAESEPERFRGRCYALSTPGIFVPGAMAPEHRAYCERSIVSIVNDDDVVPRIPPDFDRLGEVWWFDYAGALHDIADAPAECVSRLNAETYERIRSEVGDIVEANQEESADGADPEGLGTTLRGLIPGLDAHELDTYLQVLRRAVVAARPERRDRETVGIPKAVFHAEVEAVRSVQRAMKYSAPASEAAKSFRDFDVSKSFRDVEPSGSFRSADAGERFRELSTADRARDAEAAESFPDADADEGARDVEEERFPVLVRLSDTRWEPPAGMHVQTRFGPIATANVTDSELMALESDPSVDRVVISRGGGGLDLVEAMEQVHGGDDEITVDGDLPCGTGAIFGVIDTGVDIFHEAFKDDDGRLRIACIWDQYGTGGRTPKQVDPAFQQDYGRLYTRDELEAFLEAGPGETPLRLRDPHGHGTHVASIGAGRQTDKMGRGVASDATIMAVLPLRNVETNFPDSIGYSVSHVDALDLLIRAARGDTAIADEPAPIAINVSLGMNAGAHDGQSLLEVAFDTMIGLGRTPGVVIVKSAGNERTNGGHRSIQVQANTRSRITWQSGDVARASDYFELWFDWRDDIAFTLEPPPGVAGGASLSVDADSPNAHGDFDGNSVTVRLQRDHPDSSDHLLAIDIASDGAPIHPGTWTLLLVGREIGSENGTVHMWAERGPQGAVRFEPATDNCTLSIPGTANHVITVSACDRNSPPELIPQSSWGLTRKGGTKPDICAPGHQILAAASLEAPDPVTGRYDAATRKSGTSMAAPFVTGAVVLALAKRHASGQRDQLNANQIRIKLCRNTQSARPRHTNNFGFGVLDIQKFLNSI